MKALNLMVFLAVLLSSITSAEFISYDSEHPITASGQQLGYIKPYRESSILGTYTYLKWKRSGYPEGNTYPIPIYEEENLPLPFGLANVYLKVDINSITSSGVDIEIDTSEIIPNTTVTIPEVTIPDITIPEVTIPKITVPQTTVLNIDDLESQLTSKINKALNRDYHASLHLWGSRAMQADYDVSKGIEDHETKLAESATDSLVPLIAANIPGAQPLVEVYCRSKSTIPSSIRNSITGYMLNIDTSTDSEHPSDSSLANSAAFTIYVGGPAVNSLSDQLNQYLKQQNLPHFEKTNMGWVLSGRQEYTDGDVGIIAAIPEERQWDSDTLSSRWNSDKIRYYRVLIAGMEKEGTVAAGNWYNDQLDLAINYLSVLSDSTCGTQSKNILKSINTLVENSDSMYSVAALLQGWTLASQNSAKSSDFSKADSLGYVVIVKRDGKAYKVLEEYSLAGDNVGEV